MHACGLAGEFKVQGFPTIKLLYNKSGKLKAVDYKGGRSAKEIVEWALAQASKIALSRIGVKSSGSAGSGGGGGGAGAGSCGGGGGGGGQGGGGGGGGNFYGSSSGHQSSQSSVFPSGAWCS